MANNGDLQRLVKELSWNDGYGCYTRAGFEKLIWPTIAETTRWIVFFDVDRMHALNEQHGYEGVNAIIKNSLSIRGSDVMTGQWFSGDEFIVCIMDNAERGESDPMKFCMRLASIFREKGVTATFAIAPIISRDLLANVVPAMRLVQTAKCANNRNSISIVPGEKR